MTSYSEWSNIWRNSSNVRYESAYSIWNLPTETKFINHLTLNSVLKTKPTYTFAPLIPKIIKSAPKPGPDLAWNSSGIGLVHSVKQVYVYIFFSNSRLLTVSFFYLLFFYQTSFLPLHWIEYNWSTFANFMGWFSRNIFTTTTIALLVLLHNNGIYIQNALTHTSQCHT